MLDYSVLIIDDDVWMQRILSKTLASYGFKKTYLASNGFDGIALAVEHHPHLIILDIMMPDLSGHQTLGVLKSIKLTKDIPVLVVSALSDLENLGKAFKSGTDGFISKPFTRSIIFEKLTNVFGKELLGMISRGEVEDNSLMPSSIPEVQEAKAEDLFSDDDINSRSKDMNEDESKTIRKKTLKEQLLEHYSEDDEKKSIESIKKLLLKNAGK